MPTELSATGVPAWWSAVWNTLPDAILVADRRGRIEDCNVAAERMLGRARTGILGGRIGEFIPGLQDRLEATGPPPEDPLREYELRRENGSGLPVTLEIGRYRRDDRSGYVCIVHDISSRKEIEDQLRQREEQLQLTIEYAPTGMATLDLEGNIITVNEAFRTMVGYSEEELVNRPVNSITHPEDVELAELRLRELREGRIDRYRMRKRYTRKDGQAVETMLSAAAVHGADGRPLLYVAQVEDLTERLQAERDASAIREKLAHVTRVHMIGEMAAGVAHEINQPLSAIAAYAQASRRMIAGGMVTSGEVLDALDKISRQARRAGDVVASLRSLVRERSGTRERVDPNRLVRDVVEIAELDSRMCDTTMALELQPGLPRITVDTVQIQQVVLNLLLNGIESMGCPDRAGKSLTVMTGLAPDRSVRISVKDQGAGIPPEAEDDIFRSFFTTKESGMGMGLAISRSILNAHGGSLWFTRNSGAGTTFHLSIPVGAEETG